MKMQYLIDPNTPRHQIGEVFEAAVNAAFAGLQLPMYRRACVRITVEHVPLDYRMPSASFDEAPHPTLVKAAR